MKLSVIKHNENKIELNRLLSIVNLNMQCIQSCYYLFIINLPVIKGWCQMLQAVQLVIISIRIKCIKCAEERNKSHGACTHNSSTKHSKMSWSTNVFFIMWHYACSKTMVLLFISTKYEESSAFIVLCSTMLFY